MRALLAVIVVLGALWSGYWFVGSSTKHTVLETWLNDRKSEGWTVEYSDFAVVGFPNRFDSRFRDLVLQDPNSGIGWKAPLFNILALSYQPNHIIAAFAHDQQISTPDETINIKSTKMLASVTFEPNTLLALRETRLRSQNVRFKASSGWTMGADTFDLSTRKTTGVEYSHDVVFDAKKITPTGAQLSLIDPKGKLPKTIDAAHLDMVLGFSAPWDRVAVEQGAPEITSIKINRGDLVWGALGIGGTGNLKVAKNGEISGKFDLVLRNWRKILGLFVASGAINKRAATTLRNGLALMTAGKKHPNRLKIPLTLLNGEMSLGPISLGRAPRFVRN